MGNASNISVVIEFNYALRYMSSEFIRQHPDSMISYCDTFEGSVDILENRDRYGEQMHHKYYIQIACCPQGSTHIMIELQCAGFVTTTDACCGLGKYGGLFYSLN